MAIFWFYVILVHTGAVPSNSCMGQGRKCGMQGAKSIYITIGDNFVNSYEQLGDLPLYGVL